MANKPKIISMTFLEQYISSIHNPELVETIRETSSKMVSEIKTRFDFSNQLNGLLLGNVQSGKTGQTLGVISRLADEGYKLFILLTTDNVDLQRQTFLRVKNALVSFDVISERDEVAFAASLLSKPMVIVLKKNSRVLKKWKNTIVNKDVCRGLPLVILDDEADAASLNTKVNSGKVSPINKNLQSIKDTAVGTIYIQVTATPQAVILQSQESNWKPSFVTYFKPGRSYLGGNFFYSDPVSYCARFTSADEKAEVLVDFMDNGICPPGLNDSILSFLVVCAYKKLKGESNCNFMIHPGVKISEHQRFVNRVTEQLNILQYGQEEKGFDDALKCAWADLQRTKPDLPHYEDIKNTVIEILNNTEIFVIPLNSKSFVCRDSSNPDALDLSKGFNIVVGGNTLGRGITFPHLQTVYYCRTSKMPQADTMWQHSRIFGYDREPELLRMYMPGNLYKLFSELNTANEILISQVKEGLDKIELIFPKELQPTRKNVLDCRYLDVVSGGMNYFASDPVNTNLSELDDILLPYSGESSTEVSSEILISALERAMGSSDKDFDSKKFIYCINALKGKRPTVKCRLIQRTDRDISKGTGTLLSPNDRNLGDQYPDDIVLTMYRIKGTVEKGWNGNPLWIPNIKFPINSCFYDTRDPVAE